MKSLKLTLLVLVLALLVIQPLSAQSDPLVINVGTQRGSLWNVPELYDSLVNALSEGLGREVTVNLALFTSGPPLLEAFNSGGIDIGGTGDTPPIFAQAAGVPLVYVATQRSATGTAILVPQDSPIQSVADLAGKNIAFAQGSSSHFFIIQALRTAGLDYADINPIFLQPGDARAAFEGGSIDAWTIWDPFLTIAVATANARVIFDATQLPSNYSYTLARQEFAAEHPDAVQIYLEQSQLANLWTVTNADAYFAYLESETTVPAALWAGIRAQRGVTDIEYITTANVEHQQGVADIFAEVGLLPAPITVADVVWTPEGIDPAVGGIPGGESATEAYAALTPIGAEAAPEATPSS